MATKVFSVFVLNMFGVRKFVGVFDDENIVKEICNTFKPTSSDERMIYVECEMNKSF